MRARRPEAIIMMARLSVAMAIVPLGARSLRVEVSIGRTSSVHAVADCSSASRPTHFVALRLGYSVLHKAVQSVQRKVVLVDGRLKSCTVPPAKTHITGFVLTLD